MPYLKRIKEDEAKYILEEVHERICGDHTGPRSLLVKSSGQVTSGLPCRKTQRSSLSDVTSAKGLGISSVY